MTKSRSPGRAVHGAQVRVERDSVTRQLPRGRHGLSREYVRAHQRERLLAAMALVCARGGYLQATIADIVGEAGVSRRVFYTHFEGKEECFLQALAMHLQQLEHRLSAVCSRAGRGWRSRVSAVLGELLSALSERPEAAHLLFVDVHAAGWRAVALRDDVLRRHAARLPVPRGAPEELGFSVLGAVAEVIRDVVADGGAAHLNDMRAELLYALLVPLVGHDEAARERS